MWIFLIIYFILLVAFMSFVESIGGPLGMFIGMLGAGFVIYLWAQISSGGGNSGNPRDSNSQW